MCIKIFYPMATAKLNEVAVFCGHKEAVKSLGTYEAQGTKLLFSSSCDKRVLCWSLAGNDMFGKIVKEFARHGHRINEVAVAKSENFIVTACSDRLGRIIDTRTGETRLLRGHDSDLTCVAINCQENKIVTGSVDRSINLWNTEGLLLRSFGQMAEDSHADWVTCLEFKPFEENEVVSGSMDGTVKVWDVDTRTVRSTFFDGCLVSDADETPRVSDGSSSVKALTLSADGNYCAYGGNSGKVYILNLTDNELIATLPTESPVCSLAFGLTEVILACGTENKIYVWDVVNNSQLAAVDLSDHGVGVNCEALIWSANTLLAGLSNGKILVLEFFRQ